MTWSIQPRVSAMPNCQRGKQKKRVEILMLFWSHTGQKMLGWSGRIMSYTKNFSDWRRRRTVSPGVSSDEPLLWNIFRYPLSSCTNNRLDGFTWCSLVSELKTHIRKLDHETSDLKFLNNQYVHKVRCLEKDSKAKAERIQQLQEKNMQAVVQTPGNAT